MAQQTVPIIAPDGSTGEVPQERLNDALKAGGKRGVWMQAPDGSKGIIPVERQADALKAGGKLVDDETPGFFSSLLDRSGALSLPTITGLNPGGAISAGIQAVAHPVDTFNRAVQPAKDLYNEGKQAFQDARSGNTAGAIVHGVSAVPIIGSSMNAMTDQFANNNLPGMYGTGLGTAVGLVAPGVVKEGRVAGATDSMVNAASSAKNRLYPTPQSVSANELAARNLGKALVVPNQGMDNFVKAATNETGTILGYAKANNIPINSTLDFAKAAKATADAVQEHYSTNILGPHADTVVSVPSDYRGARLNVEGPRATLGEIQKRIDAINQEMSPNYRKALNVQTNAANVSDADLLAEKRGLNNLLRDKLADLTGLEPEEIAAVQQQAGKLRTIADEANLSANTNTTAAGKAAMGRSDIPTGTKLGMVERGVQALRGGPEIIGNRAVNSALRDISPTQLILPNPRVNPPGAIVGSPIPDQVAAPPIVRPTFNEPLQEYIKRKRAAQAEKGYRSAVGLRD